MLCRCICVLAVVTSRPNSEKTVINKNQVTSNPHLTKSSRVSSITSNSYKRSNVRSRGTTPRVVNIVNIERAPPRSPISVVQHTKSARGKLYVIVQEVEFGIGIGKRGGEVTVPGGKRWNSFVSEGRELERIALCAKRRVYMCAYEGRMSRKDFEGKKV